MDWKTRYSAAAIQRARSGALEWLEGSKDGYPRSWEQETANNERRGHVLYDDYDFEAPPIAGYEALEREGLALRHELIIANEQERVHFTLSSPHRLAAS